MRELGQLTRIIESLRTRTDILMHVVEYPSVSVAVFKLYEKREGEFDLLIDMPWYCA